MFRHFNIGNCIFKLLYRSLENFVVECYAFLLAVAVFIPLYEIDYVNLVNCIVLRRIDN